MQKAGQVRCDSKNVESNWYLVAGITLAAYNKSNQIRDLWNMVEHQYAHEYAHEERITAMKRMKEGILKASSPIGLPKSLNALVQLHAATRLLSHLLSAEPY